MCDVKAIDIVALDVRGVLEAVSDLIEPERLAAARALGLDCGPMSGFDNDGVDREFFAGTDIKSNFLCAIGYGTDENLFPRSPRLAFDEACRIV